MKVSLSLRDTLELSKAIKGGCLNIDKVECLRLLAKGYNPPKLVTDSEKYYYLECIYKGWGIKPQTMAHWQASMKREMPDDILQEYGEGFDDGEIYKELIKDIFIGLLALKGIGYSVDLSHKPNFDWMEKGLPSLSEAEP